VSSSTTATYGFVPKQRPLPPRRKKVLENEVLGVCIFIVSELMFFTALISAYLVIKAATGNTWTPPADVRLPVLTTALNTGVLLASGYLTFLAGRLHGQPTAVERMRKIYGAAIALGLVFVTVQGYEWLKLISVGMTLASGVFASTFFLIIGAHGLHVLGAVLAMIAVYARMQKATLTEPVFQAMRIFWYFVVGIWPVLYGLVYF
jgi:heme/copper-type cytochrome/quinol oxidase subunit 3